ncbi:hypothetical protein [Pimelobacter simplex]|uniref:hypothetical protein n=1 Tax=Nocardioides simplex TaxID=2045 RepID=UPI003AAFACBA
MSDAKLAAVVASINAAFRSSEHDIEQDWRRSRSQSGYWAMVDLRSSASYRQDAGEGQAYARALVFLLALDDLCAAYGGGDAGPVVFKRLGDGALIYSSDFRPLFEIAVVLKALAVQWDPLTTDGRSSAFAYRFAVTTGECTRVGQEAPADFLGRPLDRVARLSALDGEEGTILQMDSAIRRNGWAAIEHDYPFAKVGPDRRLPEALLKTGESVPFACGISVRLDEALGFRDFFNEIRSAFAR